MKIERVRAPETTEEAPLAEAVRTGLERILKPAEDDVSPEVRLIKKAENKRKAWRRHCQTYAVTNTALAVLNVAGAVVLGLTLPWALVPAVGWGIGFALHGLGYRSWRADHAEALQRAHTLTGLTPGKMPLALPSGLLPESELLVKCRAAVAQTEAALLAVGSAATRVDEVQADLQAGLEKVERLVLGVSRIDQTLNEIAPDGAPGMDADIAQLDRKINETTDATVKQVHHQNRALLLARKAKLEALAADRERMLAHAEGFLIATENLRLDSARLGHQAPDALKNDLTEPMRRLSDEVDILNRVEAELSRL